MLKEHRKDSRRVFSARAMVYSTDGKPIVGCALRDISVSGAQLALDRKAALPQKFVLVLSRDGKVRRNCMLAWQSSILAGAKFARPPEHRPPEFPTQLRKP
jgi:hypothetical protein